MSKFINCSEAVELIPDGASIMIGGFMGVGSPHRVIEELVRATPSAAKGRYLHSITIASPMGPGIKVDPTRTRDILEEAAPAAA